MMKEVIFNFEYIGTEEDFYTMFKREFALNYPVKNNLDALWDSVTGGIDLPCRIVFKNMSLPQLELFDDMIVLFEEAEDTLGREQLAFAYTIVM